MRDGMQRTAIEDLVVEMSIGIRDWERAEGTKQRVAFEVAVYRETFGDERTIEDCYDYSALRRFLVGRVDRQTRDYCPRGGTGGSVCGRPRSLPPGRAGRGG